MKEKLFFVIAIIKSHYKMFSNIDIMNIQYITLVLFSNISNIYK